MSSRFRLQVLLASCCFFVNLHGQVREPVSAKDVDLAASKLEGKGIRVFTIPSDVSTQRGRPRESIFVVVADAVSKTYWWMIRPILPEMRSKRFSWMKDFEGRCHVQMTPAGFTVFDISPVSAFVTIASSRGRYTDEAQLRTLVHSDFNATAGRDLSYGFGFVDGQIALQSLLERPFFFQAFPFISPMAAEPKLETTTLLDNGSWELVISSPVGKVAHITLARDLSVVSHRIVDK